MTEYDATLIIEGFKKVFNVTSDRDLAHHLEGTTFSGISNWRMRNSVPWKQVIDTHLQTGISIQGILNGAPELLSEEERAKIPMQPGNLSPIVVYDLAKSVEEKQLVNAEQEIDTAGFDTGFFKKEFSVDFENVGFVPIPDESMYPTLSQGELAAIDTSCTNFSSDGVYLFMIDDQLFVKRVQRLLTGTIKLSSDNEKFTDFELTKQELENLGVNIFGKLSMCLKRL